MSAIGQAAVILFLALFVLWLFEPRRSGGHPPPRASHGPRPWAPPPPAPLKRLLTPGGTKDAAHTVTAAGTARLSSQEAGRVEAATENLRREFAALEAELARTIQAEAECSHDGGES